MTMKPGMDVYRAGPEAIKALSALEILLQDNGLEQSLIELVKTHVSGINGCGCYTGRHSQDARKHSEAEERQYALDAWREEGPFFTDRLTMLIATINVWNWLVVSFRAVPTKPHSGSIKSCSFD
jgi:AhpD family alkylhydroperoxidase